MKINEVIIKQQLFLKKIKSRAELNEHYKKLASVLKNKENYSQRLSWQLNSFLLENVGHTKVEQFLNHFKNMDQFDSIGVKIGKRVSIINCMARGDRIELFGFIEPKVITKIFKDPDEGHITMFEFNNDENDTWPRVELAVYKGQQITHSAFFKNKMEVQHSLEMLRLAVPDGVTVTNNITEAKIVNEGLSHKIIVVDVQPEYAQYGNHEQICQQIIQFVQKQTGPVLMFVNAEDQGLSGDTMQSIQQYWDESLGTEAVEGEDENGDYYFNEPESPIDWRRFQIVDKGFGFFRAWMDQGVSDAVIIKMIRYLYQHKLNDASEVEYDDYVTIVGNDNLMDENFSINWTSVAQLKQFSGAYIVGGGRNECLREVELLMNAFNIKYKRIDSLVY